MLTWKRLILLASFSCTRQSYAAPFVVNQVTNYTPQNRHLVPPSNHQIAPENGAAVSLVRYRLPSKAPSFLSGVILVSMGNMAINWFRPDPDIGWEVCSTVWPKSEALASRLRTNFGFSPLQNRIPRLMWESLIFFTATSIKALPDSPLSYLLLSLMLGCTALIDIFFWAPIFGFATSFDNHDCSGGWFTGRPYVCTPNPAMDYIKGYGRLIVILQCLYTGVFYLKCSIDSWGEFIDQRDQIKAERQARLFQQYVQHTM
jgi:hypothetical protein